MPKLIIIIVIVLAHALSLRAQTHDTLMFSGQASGWLNYNFDEPLPLWAGARYIPQLNYEIREGIRMVDFEISANINGMFGAKPFDSITHDSNIKPYRAWARYSSDQFEIRLGLQKINFGSASMLRPLMWFDQIDPRDPLKLTNGVWGLLGRYYFLNNANLWLWTLYPSDAPKTWELSKSNSRFPEFGGRIQSPVPKGELGLTYHWRMADTRANSFEMTELAEISENRLGLDGKWDLGVGLWFEGTWISHNKSLGQLTQQTMMNVGTDYTFGIGNGLNVIFEQLFISSGEKAFQYSNSTAFSAISFSYPLSIFNSLNTILYYDWKSQSMYNFFNLRKQYNKVAVHLMAYWNPEIYQLPNQNNSGTMFAGKGIQMMIVINH